ncbi:MAG: FlgD immunoglobulin-like domain containing protein [Bacteroidales bacterium]
MKRYFNFLISLLFLFWIPFLNCHPLSTSSPSSNDTVYNWRFWNKETLKSLDAWGDSDGDSRDLLAIYEKEASDTISFRVDLMDLRADSSLNIYFAIDCKPGGNTELVKGNQTFVTDIAWDLLFVLNDSGAKALLDPGFNDHPEYLTHVVLDYQLDFLEFSIAKMAFIGWNNKPFQMQAIVNKKNTALISDKTGPVFTDSSCGRAKLVLAFGNMFYAIGPQGISKYDGFAFDPTARPGERRGSKYLFDAVEKYSLPLTIGDVRPDVMAGNEYLRVNDRIRRLTGAGLFDAPGSPFYGYFMPWQPDDVNALAIRYSKDFRQKFGLADSPVFAPYEGMLRVSDLETIRQAGYSAVFSGQYGYWFGWITDWSDAVSVKKWHDAFKKIHLANGVNLFFGTVGPMWDPRWGEMTGGLYDRDKFIGTDRGLHQWWRRILMDLAEDPDQEKYIVLGSDIGFTDWYYQDVTENNCRWIAYHPWIEATTFSDLLQRNWTPVDHGDLGLAPDEPMDRFTTSGDMHYNTYFWQFYYGGISDGHSPLVAQGDTIEAYFDYVPYLRNGQRIPSNLKMGDDKTTGTIVYQTLHNLRAAPDNNLTHLAWMSYFMDIGEQTFHTQTLYKPGELGDGTGGKYLDPAARIRANLLGQVNKIVAAAQWADEAAKGELSDSTICSSQDLELDGENEFILKNNKVFAIFENDGGRMEYGFAFHPSVGPIQIIAPTYQLGLVLFGRTNYEEGELPAENPALGETAFEEAEYRDQVFTVVHDDKSITFTSPDGRINKTFTLDNNTIDAHYIINDLDYLVLGSGLAVNAANMYSGQNWLEKVGKVEMPEGLGARVTDGGYAKISVMGTGYQRLDSFIDSPVREEMMERLDPSSYPPGHGLFFPYHVITEPHFGSGEFTLSLTLSAELPAIEGTSQVEFQITDEIYQNYPNPFNDETLIKYQLQQDSEMEINILDLQGQLLTTLEKTYQNSGIHQVIWNGADASGKPLPAGLYFYQLRSQKAVLIKKLFLFR